MRLFYYFFSLMVIAASLDASEQFRNYKFKSAIIFYDVKTSSFDDHLNSNTQGVARLVFDNWGLKELKEKDVSEVQSGDFNSTNRRHTLTLVDHGTIYTVDYSGKTIYKTRDRDLDLAISEKLDLSDESIKSLIDLGAKKVGKKKIAGFECDVWQYADQSVCLYKGIPLEIKIINAGFVSEKKAVQVILNKPIPATSFELPKFAIVTDGDYSSNQAALTRTQDYTSSVTDLKKEMKKKGIDLEENNTTITPKLEKDIINVLGKRYLTKQKKYLPKLLEALKAAKVCIAKAQSKEAAQKCLAPVEDIDNKLGDQAHNFDFNDFDATKRLKAVNTLDKEIKNTEITNNCVSKYNKTTDVIVCTEGRLYPQESANITPVDTNSSSLGQ